MPSASNVPRTAMQLVIYRVAGRRFALPLAAVEYVVPAVEITPLPGAPASAAGVINVHGSIMPVLDCRRCFGLPVREIDPGDQLIIARLGARAVALWVDEVEGVHECTRDGIVPAENILAGTHSQGVLKLPDGDIVLLQELDQCLSPGEENQLAIAMESS